MKSATCRSAQRGSRRAAWLAPACLLFIAAAATAALAQPPEMPPAPVVVAEVVRDRIQAKLRFSGALISRYEAELSAETEGRVIALASIGTRFARGDAVARLDDVLLQQILLENRAGAESRRARIKFLQNEVKRLGKLAESSNAAISLLEKTQSDLDVARSELAAAEARAAQTGEKIRRMRIAAPFDGVVSEVHTEIGEWVSAGDVIAELVNTDVLEIKTHVSPDVLPYIRIGDLIEVSTGNSAHEAELRTIVPVGDKASRLFELRLAPRESIGQPGLPVQVAVPVTAPRNSLLVPEDALVIRHDGISVFRVEENMTASRIPVKIGLSTRSGLVEINGSLEAGDRVVTRGGERLRHGAKVRMTPRGNGG